MKGRCIEARWDTDDVSVTQDEFKRRGRLRDVIVSRGDPRFRTDMYREKVGGRGLRWCRDRRRATAFRGAGGRKSVAETVQPTAEGADRDMTAATKLSLGQTGAVEVSHDG